MCYISVTYKSLKCFTSLAAKIKGLWQLLVISQLDLIPVRQSLTCVITLHKQHLDL